MESRPPAPRVPRGRRPARAPNGELLGATVYFRRSGRQRSHGRSARCPVPYTHMKFVAWAYLQSFEVV
ncbi:hypothetical protein EVAR_88851_1 [Eumeta japonica]|uniref:Uncharacterized protein n=1 Tax=Eumeta variegata TaxID=151549 RepID=A0A4C1Y466_EUMVA|nr:hypothetical protein EVAR_88851_1 [Eumeta japonica]